VGGETDEGCLYALPETGSKKDRPPIYQYKYLRKLNRRGDVGDSNDGPPSSGTENGMGDTSDTPRKGLLENEYNASQRKISQRRNK
jgi:hypothetical protein